MVLAGATKTLRFPGIFFRVKPSDGLEPSTPLTMEVSGRYARTRATTRDSGFLQIRLFARPNVRREASRVSFLMCPFCVRGQLTTETTSSLRRACEANSPSQRSQRLWLLRPR
jgi:hypothetical protein